MKNPTRRKPATKLQRCTCRNRRLSHGHFPGQCSTTHVGWLCTRRTGHAGDHIACSTDQHNLAVWTHAANKIKSRGKEEVFDGKKEDDAGFAEWRSTQRCLSAVAVWDAALAWERNRKGTR